MCVIIIKQRNINISTETLRNSSRINPHGLGVVWLDTFEVTYHGSKDWRVLDTARPFIAHFRYATVGKVGIDNTHPFRCGAQSNEYLMMNGTINGMGNAQSCDSKVLAESLGSVPRHRWKSELEKHKIVRFVTINTRNRTFQIYNRDLWTFKDGVWYSKDNVLQNNLVAVYGTLKKGNSNYYKYLSDSKFVSSGKTEDKYPLIVKGLPYLIEEKGIGHNVKVDVFKVSDSALQRLDQLEGHPSWYCRKQVPIVLKSKKVVMCWVYFSLSAKISQGDVLHKSYEVLRTLPMTKTLSQVDYSNPTWKPSYQQLRFDSLDQLDAKLKDSEIDEDEEFIDSPYCISCYRDIEHDGYGNYYCNHCDDWYTQQEIDRLMI